jgi:pimeloyl-[acyl-carrier protein] methyl ester esterase
MVSHIIERNRLRHHVVALKNVNITLRIAGSDHPNTNSVLRPLLETYNQSFTFLISPDCLAPTTLVLLPGLDGTEVFFRPLLATLPPLIQPKVIGFPPLGGSEYPDLLAIVRKAVTDIPSFYVLGSSFAGPLALMLAEAEPDKVRGVILATTFVSPPRPIYVKLRFTAISPTIWMLRACRRIPVWLFREPTNQLRLDKAETWKRVSASIVAARIRVLLNVNARKLLKDCQIPVLCIAGSDDGVVPRRNVEEIVRVRPSVSVRIIKGDHFAIYTNPTAAAESISAFLQIRKKHE